LIERLQTGALAHRRPQKTRKCPDEDRLRLLLPGQLEPAEAEKLLTHAAGCDWCGTVLREAAQDLPDPPTGEEEELAGKSRLADPSRRRELVERIVSQRKQTGGGPWPAMLRWWPAGGLAAAAAAAGVLFQLGWLGGIPGAERLTCRAYAEQRDLQMRLMACAVYAPINTERGAETSRLARPDLLEAEARVARGVESHPNDPAWLRMRGRMDLLDGKVDPAIAELDKARSLRPKDAGILSDLGMAYFRKAERTSPPDPEALARAFDRLSEGARLKADDPVLLFNRALAAESQFDFTEARDDWDAYLRIDATSGWAREARAHLEEVKKKSIASGNTPPPPPRKP